MALREMTPLEQTEFRAEMRDLHRHMGVMAMLQLQYEMLVRVRLIGEVIGQEMERGR